MTESKEVPVTLLYLNVDVNEKSPPSGSPGLCLYAGSALTLVMPKTLKSSEEEDWR